MKKITTTVKRLYFKTSLFPCNLLFPEKLHTLGCYNLRENLKKQKGKKNMKQNLIIFKHAITFFHWFFLVVFLSSLHKHHLEFV